MSRPSVSVIIPSADGRRGGNVDLLVRDLEGQSLRPQEMYVIKGVSPSGLARNTGARRASGDVLVFLDDDVRLGHEKVLEAMIAPLEEPGIGMAGAAQLLPSDSSAFQRAAARQIPRSRSAVVSVATDSDMVTTGCCTIRRALFWELGGFNEHIPRGVDPEMRHRVRSKGLRVVVAPHAWFYHPMPVSVLMLCRTFFRNGQHSAETTRLEPWAALETPDGHIAHFVRRRGPMYRMGRYIGRFILDLAMLRWIDAAAKASYLAGYVWRRAQLCAARTSGSVLGHDGSRPGRRFSWLSTVTERVIQQRLSGLSAPPDRRRK